MFASASVQTKIKHVGMKGGDITVFSECALNYQHIHFLSATRLKHAITTFQSAAGSVHGSAPAYGSQGI